ncbi:MULTISPECIES: hypothetical protein [Proteus]|uniref:hypothetical protein n=1 Tax=Proteus TaxID=583 RepID=UPI000D68EDF9|nr:MULTISPECIES: hypothetical protein [Proteus]
MSKSSIAIAGMALAIASMSTQVALWEINHHSQLYNCPQSTNRITGHAKINRAAKKRRARK